MQPIRLPLVTLCVGALAASLVIAPASAGDRPGSDPKFGTNGIVDRQLDGSFTYGDNIARQGKGLVVSATVGQPNAFGVARFTSRGKLDRSFGTNGVARYSSGDGRLQAYSLAVQEDGKILQVGSRFVDGKKVVAVVVRYIANGKRDKSFAKNGVKRVAFPNDIWLDGSEIISVDSKNRIVLTGTTGPECGFVDWGPQNCQAAVVRLRPNGNYDKSFGSQGRAVVKWGSRLFQPRALLVRSNDSVVITGQRTGDGAYIGAAAALTHRGRLDKSFGKAGKKSLQVAESTALRAAAEDSTGRLVVAASSGTTDDSTFTVVRLTRTGKVDKSFGRSGVVRRDVVPGTSNGARSVLIAPNGRIFVAGMAFLDPGPTRTAFALAQIKPSGKFVGSFGKKGIKVTNFDMAPQMNGMAWRSAASVVLSGGYATLDTSGLILAAYSTR